MVKQVYIKNWTVGMHLSLLKEAFVFPKEVEIVYKIHIKHGTCKGVPSRVLCITKCFYVPI